MGSFLPSFNRLMVITIPIVAMGALLSGVYYFTPTPQPKVRAILVLEKPAPVLVAPPATIKPLQPHPTQPIASGNQNTKGRIALIITGLGMNEALTHKAIKDLPTNVTMAFTPYTPLLRQFLTDNKVNGHEALLLIPMEGQHYPLTDSGPLMLKRGDPKTMTANLDVLLTKGTDIIGVMDMGGSALMQNKEAVGSLFRYLHDKKILFVDGRSALLSEGPAISTTVKNPYISVTHILDDAPSPTNIKKAFDTMADQAHVFSYAIGIIHATPFSMQFIPTWVKAIKSYGLELVPLSTLVPTPGTSIAS